MHKRITHARKIHFGTLVHILNNPVKYSDAKTLFDDEAKTLKEKEINTSKYGFLQVSEAIDVLALNDQIEDYAPESVFSNIEERTISIKAKGVIDFRENFYLKKAAAELSINRAI